MRLPVENNKEYVFKIRQVQSNELPETLILMAENSKNMIFEIKFYSHLIFQSVENPNQ